MKNLDVTFSEESGIRVVHLNGRLDSATTPEVEKMLLSELSGHKRWLLDLEEVSYISSAGLRMFLLMAKKLREEQGIMAICSLKPEVFDIFYISGFSTLFTMMPDRVTGLLALQ